MNKPALINLINNELCIAWENGTESYLNAEYLRQHSPSAENIGEKDILGNHYGSHPLQSHQYRGITLTDFEYIGNYALKLTFSDGHKTGIYSWDYLQKISNHINPVN